MYPGIRYPSMCYSSRATNTVVFWFLLLASLAICHDFQGCSNPMTVEKQRHKVHNCCLYMVFTVFTRSIPCFTVILPLSYHHISPLSSPPQDSDTADRAELWIFLGHDVVSVLASACATLPWSNRVAGRWGVHAACTAWGLDHWIG